MIWDVVDHKPRARRPTPSPYERLLIVRFAQFRSQREIARLTGFSRSAVQRVVARYQQTGSADGAKLGRPLKTAKES